MGAVVNAGSTTGRLFLESPGRTRTRNLLVGGIVAVGLYGAGDLISGLLYDGYSFKDQAISELTAFGSPVRPLMTTVVLLHAVLVAALGLGVWREGDRRSLRVAGGFLIAAGAIGFPTHTVFAMSSRTMDSGFNDAMHIALSSAFSIFVFGAISAAAVARRGWFRAYSIATLIMLLAFGAAASIAMAGIAENATPWAGGFERVNAYAYFAWLIVLAVTSLRELASEGKREVAAVSSG